MSPGPTPTSVPSGILIHPTVWPQYANVTDSTNMTDSIMANRYTYKRWPKKQERVGLMKEIYDQKHKIQHKRHRSYTKLFRNLDMITLSSCDNSFFCQFSEKSSVVRNIQLLFQFTFIKSKRHTKRLRRYLQLKHTMLTDYVNKVVVQFNSTVEDLPSTKFGVFKTESHQVSLINFRVVQIVCAS